MFKPIVICGTCAFSGIVIAINKMRGDKQYYNFPLHQKFKYSVEPPLWNYNWDNKKSSGNVIRHLLFIRHGQYDETSKDDKKRILTPLGRRQAKTTGKRLLDIINYTSKNENVSIGAIYSSNMTRAIETADIIMKEIEKNKYHKITRTEPDPNLNEGHPCHAIPYHKKCKSSELVAKDGPIIENAFNTYFYRSSVIKENNHHEFDIIVCHGNVIRYFFMRALQLPPEAWLRMTNFNCSLTYFQISRHGNVQCRTFGDIGHLSMDQITFSNQYGLNW
jgi:serine/threonine-protein phosphatase PGAM5